VNSSVARHTDSNFAGIALSSSRTLRGPHETVGRALQIPACSHFTAGNLSAASFPCAALLRGTCPVSRAIPLRTAGSATRHPDNRRGRKPDSPKHLHPCDAQCAVHCHRSHRMGASHAWRRECRFRQSAPRRPGQPRPHLRRALAARPQRWHHRIPLECYPDRRP
jgi:hypothetical protein